MEVYGMRELSASEVLSLRELLQMETNALAKMKVTQAGVMDDDLKKAVESSVLAGEKRIKGLQQFISENNILLEKEVH
jgi:hypothetical protein